MEELCYSFAAARIHYLPIIRTAHFPTLVTKNCEITYGSNLRLSELDPAGRSGTVVGWGRTSEGGMLPGVLQEVQVPILSLSQCRTMKYKASRITTYMLCAGKGNEDSCQVRRYPWSIVRVLQKDRKETIM